VRQVAVDVVDRRRHLVDRDVDHVQREHGIAQCDKLVDKEVVDRHALLQLSAAN
jgi:hypothetical protein